MKRQAQMQLALKLFLTLTTILGVFHETQAQRGAWKRQRYDAMGGLGFTTFLGDLGGGSENSVSDLDIATIRPVLVLGGRYKVLEPVALGVSLSFGYLRGDDKWSEDPFRNQRNLSFRSPIIEFATYGEYHIIKEKFGRRTTGKRIGSFFSWQNIQALPINTYVFAGVSFFWFNPQGLGPDGKWYKLHDIGTEGQYIIPTRKPYSRLQVGVPFGLGVRYPLNRKFSLGLEYGARLTFTDYIDDVSKNYVDPNLFDDPIARYLSNPGLPYEDGRLYVVGPNDRRGNALNNDYFMFTVITLSYKMRTGRGGLPKF